ncbi:MAG: hypothetical protein HYS12_25905 [Planctomycetes bacterium]|nr:hypothetical protein [Planctomycetota bacterium]
MFRMRLTTLAAAAGLGLIGGCAGMNSNQSLLGRLCGRQRTTEACVIDPGVCGNCCGGACDVVGDGPVLMDRGPIVLPPSTVPSVPLAPDSSLPLTPAPRLVPQPQPPTQSQPIPYTP